MKRGLQFLIGRPGKILLGKYLSAFLGEVKGVNLGCLRGKSILDKRNRKSMDPEAEVCLLCFWNSSEATVAETE